MRSWTSHEAQQQQALALMRATCCLSYSNALAQMPAVEHSQVTRIARKATSCQHTERYLVHSFPPVPGCICPLTHTRTHAPAQQQASRQAGRRICSSSSSSVTPDRQEVQRAGLRFTHRVAGCTWHCAYCTPWYHHGCSV